MSGSVERLRDAVTVLERVVAELEPGALDAATAETLVDTFTRGERICGAGRALAARRAEDAGVWRRDGHRSGAHWLAATTGVTVGNAVASLETARALDQLPATSAAYRSGALSATQAHEISSVARDDPGCEEHLLAIAERSSLKDLRDHCRTARTAVDDAAVARHLHASRYVHRWTDRDGAYRIDARLSPDAGAKVDAALRGHTDRIFTAARRSNQREPWAAYAADALVAAVTGGPCKPIDVRLTVSHPALVRGYVEPGERCEIAGIGPVPVTTASHLLDDSSVSVLALEGDDVSRVSSPKRTIPATLRRALEARHPKCAVDGCDASEFLQIDHVVPIEHGGPTTLDNTWRLCTHHHDLKTYRGWRVVAEGGARTLVAPAPP